MSRQLWKQSDTDKFMKLFASVNPTGEMPNEHAHISNYLDSLDLIELVIKIEKAFGIEIEDKEINTYFRVRDIIHIIQEKDWKSQSPIKEKATPSEVKNYTQSRANNEEIKISDCVHPQMAQNTSNTEDTRYSSPIDAKPRIPTIKNNETAKIPPPWPPKVSQNISSNPAISPIKPQSYGSNRTTFKNYCFYIPKRHGEDELSEKLIRFKENKEIDFWSDIVCKDIKSQNWKVDFVVRALGHSELSSNLQTPLDKLCKAIADKCGYIYMPNLISKKRSNKALHTLNKKERAGEMQNMFSINTQNIPSTVSSILIVDDIKTTGATLNAMSLAFRKQYPKLDIYQYVIAQTSDNPDANKKFYH